MLDRVRAGPSLGRARLRARPAETSEQRESVEQRLLGGIAFRGLFRVPLHAEHPGRTLVLLVGNDPLDRFDQAVLGPARHGQAVAQTIDPLMVMREAGERRGLRDGGEAAPRFGVDLVDRLAPVERHTVHLRARDVGEVSMQGASERDVHDLDAAADTERRHRDPVGRQDEIDLEPVSIRLDAVDVRVRGSAVSRRVDVATADEEEAVERLEELLRIPLLTRREDHRPSAGAAERVQVQSRDAVPALGPPGDAIAAQVVRHARRSAVGSGLRPRRRV